MDKLELAYDQYCKNGTIEFIVDANSFRIQAEEGDIYLMKEEEIMKQLGDIEKACNS